MARSGCTRIGLDISENQLEYPFQALLRERNPKVRFVHTGVTNASARYADRRTSPPRVPSSAPIASATSRRSLVYREIGPPVEIGRFLLFLR